MTDFAKLLEALVSGGVQFIVVGGAAATAHGAARLTVDLDIVYGRTRQNMEKLAATLAPLHPYPRGAPAGLPFLWDAATIQRGLNFTLITDYGDLDLLGEITGGGGYDALEPHCTRLRLFGVECLCLNLRKLIEVKRACGRPKDFEAIAELEGLAEEQA